MRRIHLLSIVLVGIMLVLSSCNGLSKMVKNHASMVTYEATPNPLELHGDKVKVNLTGKFAPKYFAKGVVVVLQPGIQTESGVELLKPIVLRGEKTQASGTMINEKQGGSFNYTDEIAYKKSFENARLIINPAGYTEKQAKGATVSTEAEAMAVPKSARLGEVSPAEGTVITPSRIATANSAISTETHRYEKETIIPIKATIYFLVDQHNLNWNIPFNKMPENKAAIKTLDSAFGTGMAMKSVVVSAWASPEGEETRNQNLSERRTQTGVKYFKSAYEKILKQRAKKEKVKVAAIRQDVQIDEQSLGEDWDGFIADLRASDIAEKSTIINVISSHTDKAAREQEIRNMTVIYEQIEEKILPSLRRSEILVNFLQPKKTDEQIAELSLTSPAELDIEELLYSVTLTEDRQNIYAIYNSAMEIYPDDFRAYLNAAVMYFEDRNYDKAGSLLEAANAVDPENGKIINNLGAVALAKKDFENARLHFENAQRLGNKEAATNMGIFNIKDGNYEMAVNTLGSEPCKYNLALAQLMNGRTDLAKATLRCMKEATADSYYLLAVCAAREDNVKELVDALRQAISLQPNMKTQAQNDKEFSKLKDNSDFQSAIR